ncbi:Dyp-type peroxidase [Myriangium duriaei CBS 260.36]|uniref:Dyp-type peroxidase n=1 Tax=Myriangium duriaei CBS 260.36 TaxID=1168546 RepID=A0A9P4MKP8_9PEZI|nr:Dyp-type peroxidase [Myriangium duriaei CBS 260.36]
MTAPHLPKLQQLDTALTRSALFLVCTIKSDPNAISTVRSALAGLSGLAKNISIRDLSASFAVTTAIGPSAWPRLTSLPLPKELHPLPVIQGRKHSTCSTPGDLLFHIRAHRPDLCFEFATQLLSALGASVTVVDEVQGFRYFDTRDLLGFVDGTANPVSADARESVFVMPGEDNDAAVGGSYVVVQKYLHDMDAWRRLSVEQQEGIVGRRKLENTELEDAGEGEQLAHKTLATIEQDGEEFDILRDNMPFGSPGKGEFGTYFIGYSRRLWVVERMLERMFKGVPEGMHDRILDYSRPVTGSTFFAPSQEVLDGLG